MAKHEGYWKKHPKPDLQQLLIDLDAEKWRIVDPPTYYKVLCPCPQKHKTWVHLTPKNRDYAQQKRTYLSTHACFNKAGR